MLTEGQGSIPVTSSLFCSRKWN